MEFWKKLSQQERDETLQDAFNSGNFALVKLVLEAGKISKYKAQYYLLTTIYHKRADVLDLLLDAGAEVGEYELRVAVKVGSAEIIDTLLQTGVKPYSRCVIEAVRVGNNEALDKLLNAGGKPDTRCSCCINMATKKGFADTVRTLLAYGEKATNVRPNVLAYAKRRSMKPRYAETLQVLKEAGLSTD